MIADRKSEPLLLREFDGRDRPLSNVAFDRDSQAVEFVQPNGFRRPRLSVGEYYGLADKLRFRLLKRVEDC